MRASRQHPYFDPRLRRGRIHIKFLNELFLRQIGFAEFLVDDTFEKMPFYAKLGVPELWIIDRDTKRVELHVLREARYQLQSPGEDG